jgi:hypothetical protein
LSWPGHNRSKNGVASLAYSRPKDGAAEFTLGLAEGKTPGLAYVPAFQVLPAAKTWMPGIRRA